MWVCLTSHPPLNTQTTGTFSLRGISNTAFSGTVYGVAPLNRCSVAGVDDGKMAYGYYLDVDGQDLMSLLLCFHAGTRMEWRAIGGPAPVAPAIPT